MKRKPILLLLCFVLLFSLFEAKAFAAETVTLHREVPVYSDSISAQNQVDPFSTYPAGVYYLYKTAANGMLNVSRTEGTPGGWINPGDNQIPPPPGENEPVYRWTTAGALNLRSGPGAGFAVVVTIPYASKVELLEAGLWSRIRHEGQEGWVSEKYLSGSEPSPVPQTGSFLTRSQVNLRSGPSVSFPIVLSLPQGTKVQQHFIQAGWSNVTALGKTGFVASSYLTPWTQEPAPLTKPYITTASVRFRSGPDTSSPIYATLAGGTEVSLISSANGWSNVIYQDKIGYIASSYLVPKGSVTVKPKIGISWTGKSNSLVTYTAYSIEKAGGEVVYLPQVSSASGASAAIKQVDGMVLVGGEDIGPSYYGQTPISRLEYVNSTRDKSDYYLIKAAYAADLPTLGLCRGMQWINVITGGSLYQDVRSQFGITVRHRDADQSGYAYHNITVSSGTILSSMIGSGTKNVNSWHHQGIRRLGSYLRISARSADGLPEAIEATNKQFMVGIQFHSEAHVKYGSSLHLNIFKKLVSAAR